MTGPRPRWVWGSLSILLAAGLPLFISTPYFLRVMILTGLFVVLAVSYDLVVGQVGAFSLAHPAFYGIGAYAVAILTTKAGWGFAPAFLAAAVVAGLAAVLVGIPSFRLQGRSFAIGTLGMLLVLQLVATNWISLTEGPMCITGVKPLSFALPGGLQFSTAQLKPTYYGILVLAVATYVIVGWINSSRVGRAFRAVRENELLAESEGVHSLFYKMLAFAIGSALAGVAGGYYATWSSLVCPTEMALPYTITLLIIINIGGAGSLRGVTLGAVIFTILPELLRFSKEARLVVYGLVLLLAALYMPQGFEGLIRKAEKALERRSSPSAGSGG